MYILMSRLTASCWVLCIHLFLFPFQEKCGFNSEVLVPFWVNSAFEKVHLTIQNTYGTMHWSQRNRQWKMAYVCFSAS